MSATAEKPARTLHRKAFQSDIPFTKGATSSTGDIEIKGYANTWEVDRDGDLVDPKAFDETLPLYLSKNPILLYGHRSDVPIGVIKQAQTDETGLHVTGLVSKPESGEDPVVVSAYSKIKAGILRTLSIGGFMNYDIEGKQLIIRQIELFEISVVAIPANADSIFEATMKAARSDDEQPKVALSERAVTQMKQLLGLEPVTDPDLLTMDDDGRSARHIELAALYERADAHPPDFDAYATLDAKLTAVAADPLEQAKLLPEMLALLKQVAGGVPLSKRGRMISAYNEDQLKKSITTHQDAIDMHHKGMDLVQGVLDKLSTDRESTSDVGTEEPNFSNNTVDVNGGAP